MRQWLEHHTPLFLGVVILYVIFRNVIAAGSESLGFDELCTWAVTSQPTVSAMWSSISRGVDTQPIGFYLFEKAAAAVIPNKEIAYRFPSILGFPLTLTCVFLYLRRRSGNLYAFVSSLFLLLTSLYVTFAVDARPYSLLVAAVSFSLLCYQRARSAFWIALLGLGLGIAQSLHFYAVFALIPFLFAEAYYFLRTRSFRWGVWSAFLISLVPLFLMLPLIASLRRYYGAHFWGLPSVFGTARIYGWLFHMPAPMGVAAAAVLAAGLFYLPWISPKPVIQDEQRSAGRHQDVLLLALLGLPIIGFTVTKLMHSGLVDRYVLAAVVVIPVAIGCLLPSLERQVVNAIVFFVFLAISLQEVSFWSSHRNLIPRPVSPSAVLEDLLRSDGVPKDLPVVVSDGREYLPLAHYSAPPLARRLFAVVDIPMAVALIGKDSVDKDLVMLDTVMPLQIYQYLQFSAIHRAFLLYSTEAPDGFDWWPSRLLNEGNDLRVVALSGNRKIYLVHLQGHTQNP